MRIQNKTDAPVLITDLRLTVPPRGQVTLNQNQVKSRDLQDMIKHGFLRVVSNVFQKATGAIQQFVQQTLHQPKVPSGLTQLEVGVQTLLEQMAELKETIKQQPQGVVVSQISSGEEVGGISPEIPVFVPEAKDLENYEIKTENTTSSGTDVGSAVARLRQARKKKTDKGT